MINIQLARKAWQIDLTKQLGEQGGFGAVFEGNENQGQVVAIKRINKDLASSANREIRIAESVE